MDRAVDAGVEIMAERGKLNNGIGLVALESIERGMDWENTMLERDAQERGLGGTVEGEGEGEEMNKTLALGNVDQSTHNYPAPVVQAAEKASSLSPWLAAAIGALGIGGPLAGVATYALLSRNEPAPAVEPADSEYEIRFFDADGNPISVPRQPGN